MQFLLEIDDALAPSLIEVIRNLRSAKAVLLTPKDAKKVRSLESKEALLADLSDAVQEVTLARQGNVKLKSGREFLREL